MHAIILAGGSGTRLRPLTYARRKELIPLLNRPLLEYRLLNLNEHGIRDIVLACSQGAGEIQQHFGDGSSLGVRIQYVYEEKPLGSGRAVKEAARTTGATGAMVVCNGDILTNVDLRAMIARHEDTRATLSISLAPVEDPWHFGVVAVDQELRISHFIEKPPRGEEPSNLINAGTWIWEPEVLERIPDDESAVRDQFSERVLFPGIIADGLRVQGFQEDLWVDVGAPDRYFRATRLLLERHATTYAPGKKDALLEATGADIALHRSFKVEGPVMLDDGARVARRVRLVAPTVIGPRVTLDQGVQIERSIIWEDALISEDAVVVDSIVGAGVTIGARAKVRNAILADKSSVPAGIEFVDASLMPGETAGESYAIT
jgi:mannose-1-phosphate guanylyltransferase